MSAYTYRGILLPDPPTPQSLASLAPDYQAMLCAVMEALADRYEKSPDYPYIDSKLDLISGTDFADADPIRGKGAVYGWIQGRGLEALAGHLGWMKANDLAPDLVPRLEIMMAEVLERLREIRSRNNGRLHFLMTPEGNPFRLNVDTRPEPFHPPGDHPYGFSDLFSAKGMFAAASHLGNAEARAEALTYCRDVDEAIWTGRFQSDQQSLDPRSPEIWLPGCHPHGPYMIQIGTAALLTLAGEPSGLEMGFRLVRHELDRHINVEGRIPELAEGDFWEAVDDQGQPYREEDGRIVSDPGHALECVGLALRFARAVRLCPLSDRKNLDEAERIEQVMPRVLVRNFQNGFLTVPEGICKSFDLVARQPINTDMPWWNLPETMRASAFCLEHGDIDGLAPLDILSACHRAFTTHFVRPDLHLMAYQTRSDKGEPIPVIPATADADPGYHTGLSIIDMLEVIEVEKQGSTD